MSFKFQDHEIEFEYESYRSNDDVLCVDCEARNGSTVLLCKVQVGAWTGFEGCLPLTVNYSERFFANNRIPAGFSKRENKREVEILASRFIDRAVRPTIDESFRFSININCTVISYSKMCPPEALAITATSSALVLAGVPCNLVAGIYLTRVNNRWTLNTGSANNLIVAGNYYGVSAFEMSGEQLNPDQVCEGLRFSASQIAPLIDFVRQKIKKHKQPVHMIPALETHNTSVDTESIVKAYFNNQKENFTSLYSNFAAVWSDKNMAKSRWEQIVRSVLRMNMIWTGKRLDGRDFDSFRHLVLTKDFIPSHHCVVSRGRTKVLAVVTASNNSNESQLYETLDQNENRKFLVHYNYHPDCRPNGQPQRREIGHGNLIRNALKSLIQNDRFMRIANEVIKSDGGSSMSGVLASSIALQNAGIEIPIVSGLSIGILMQPSTYKFFSDLTAMEDALSDMDLKLAGTKNGITAIQLDIKIPFLPWNILEHALQYGFNALFKMIKNLHPTSDVTKKDKNWTSSAEDRMIDRGDHKLEAVDADEIDKDYYQTENQDTKENYIKRKEVIDLRNGQTKDRYNDQDLVEKPSLRSKEWSPNTDSDEGRNKAISKAGNQSPRNSEESRESQENKNSRLYLDSNKSAQIMHKTSPKIVLKLDEIQINRIIEAKFIDSETSINGTVLTTGLGVINKLLTIALSSNKEVFYSKVVKIINDTIDLQVLSNGSKVQIKKEAGPGLIQGQLVAIAKGKFGRWIVISKLEKDQSERV